MDFAKALASNDHGASEITLEKDWYRARSSGRLCSDDVGRVPRHRQRSLRLGELKWDVFLNSFAPFSQVVDPETTMRGPSVVTRNTGDDALMHAVESFIAVLMKGSHIRPILDQGAIH